MKQPSMKAMLVATRWLSDSALYPESVIGLEGEYDDDHSSLALALDAFAAEAVIAFYERVNARAEDEVLAGNPVAWSHHHALENEISAIRARGKE